MRICRPVVELNRMIWVFPRGIRKLLPGAMTSVFLSQVMVSSGPG
jgi:hypothetical protein